MDRQVTRRETGKGVEVFCCYARKDQPLFLELKTHLAPLQREGLITLWSDIDIDAGAEWKKEIHSRLNTAQIILLLISPDFVASDQCYGIEMQRSLERHECSEAQVVPIILRPVSWKRTPIGKLQALPTNAEPITSGKWHHQDEAFYEVVEGIRNIIDILLSAEKRWDLSWEIQHTHLPVNPVSEIAVLCERYQIQEPIGCGNIARIYRGYDLLTDRLVAIKVMHDIYLNNPKIITRFKREAKTVSSLQHPNIVQVYDSGMGEGDYFIVMEYIDGTDLRRYLRSRGVLAVDRVAMIAHDVALGLGAAHSHQIVHRDVKPQNILIGRDASIKLTDFGSMDIFKVPYDECTTTLGTPIGTVHYYAPEQTTSKRCSPATDVYALGIVMYEMLTGRPPFDGNTPVVVAMQHIQDIPVAPSQLNSTIPPDLEDIVMRCLEKEPEMRYPDGNALAHALESLGDGASFEFEYAS